MKWGQTPLTLTTLKESDPISPPVIPAKAGIHVCLSNMDPRFRGDDGEAFAGMTEKLSRE